MTAQTLIVIVIGVVGALSIGWTIRDAVREGHGRGEQ
jgi:hypothetical protein